MSNSVRIDWFDETVIEVSSQNQKDINSTFEDEECDLPQCSSKSQQIERKPIGFKRLFDISLLNPSTLILQLTRKQSFWMLLNMELKGDYIVLIVRILTKLYKSLENNEKSIIIKDLENGFERSVFMKTLNDYLITLPNVRVIEKRMNSLLWDDIESFYYNLLELCQGVFDYNKNNSEFLFKILELLNTMELSILGVKEEHSEIFNDNLLLETHNLKTSISSRFNKDIPTTSSKIDEPKMNANIHNFRDLNIFPTREDLLNKDVLTLEPNVVNGAYKSVEAYLDLQFKLMREDCYGPLRDGLSGYFENPNKKKYENIRVYAKVRIIRSSIYNNKVGYLIDIAWTERSRQCTVDSKRLASKKHLMYGSLLLFTANNFETILCATVLDSSLNLLTDGYIMVSFQSPLSKSNFSEPYLMIESEVFFEPYHRVLESLQNCNFLPMKKYIVDVQKKTEPPSYLSLETIYTITDPKTEKEISLPVLKTDQWPHKCLDLDESQLEAYKYALTHEFAVIQGPPGTGKTFIGIKIATILLENLSLTGTPMLIICYTNHALDQFLENILKVTENIVRLGSQSKNPKLDSYNLNCIRTKVKSKYSYLYTNKRKELEAILKDMTELQDDIDKCEKGLLSYKSIKNYLKSQTKSIELNKASEDPIINWLFDNNDSENEVIEDWESNFENFVLDDELEVCFSEELALKEIDSMHNSIKYIKDVSDNNSENEQMIEKFEDQLKKVRKRLALFKKYISLSPSDMRNNAINTKPYDMSIESRWQAYSEAVHVIKEQLMSKMNTFMGQHRSCESDLEEISNLIDLEAMSKARVVGITTAAAARRKALIDKLNAGIVIVEEAAEVLEAHIVASLSKQCQHLILIGDHKQLRPTAAHYTLAKRCNLEISLFERMVSNGVHARTLAIQRRMRPNIAELLVPTVYEALANHEDVTKYGGVDGVVETLYFFNHCCYEDSEGLEDNWSHKNLFEAKWCVHLADYLVVMGHKPEDVTILATYNGQVSLIKELSKKYASLGNVKVTAVDNYQGEENKIVILSLVRSNRDGRIGFLNAANRICVALSRAKEGFYMFGNMDTLKSSSSMWSQINDKLLAQNAIGSKLTLQCPKHKDNIMKVTDVEILANCLRGNCLKICK